MPKRILAVIAFSLCFSGPVGAQQSKGKLVVVAQTHVLQHTVHVLVCSRPEPNTPEPELRILLACNQDNAPACLQYSREQTGTWRA
jgi:hypothetical protein